jgi:hypothetical protein
MTQRNSTYRVPLAFIDVYDRLCHDDDLEANLHDLEEAKENAPFSAKILELAKSKQIWVEADKDGGSIKIQFKTPSRPSPRPHVEPAAILKPQHQPIHVSLMTRWTTLFTYTSPW